MTTARSGISKRALPLDHLVFAVPDLAEAIADFEDRLGIAPSPGGVHEGLGTHNAILPVGDDAYVELVAAYASASSPKGPRPFGLDDLERPRLATWAVRATDIDAAVARSRQRGFDPGIVLEVSRRQPDGDRLQWKLTLRRDTQDDGLIPFLIDWADAPHPSTSAAKGCHLSAFALGHPDSSRIRDALVALGVAVEVEARERPFLKAIVTGPRGELRLGSSSDPTLD